jgi:2-methylisocitrate lyase-like PEP mutase family enzyme
MDVTQAQKIEQFHRLHERPGVFLLPNPWDVGTARVLAGLGYEALATTSAGLAFTLGRRDGVRAVTRAEALAHARQIVAATPLPVSADLENGFGDDPETVAETIRLAAEAGLAGASVEDATGRTEEPIYPFAQAVDRVAAAVRAARSAAVPLVLTARAENFLHGRPDLDDTIRRLRAFERAGADVLYAPGLPDLVAIRAVCAAVGKPVNVLAGRSFTVPELVAAGARRVSLGSTLARAALGAFLRAAREVKEQGTFGFTAGAAPSAELDPFMSDGAS